jgi:S-adenosylmethionine uptake transporter
VSQAAHPGRAQSAGALWMLLASVLFSSMGVCIKLASPYFNAFELVFYRGLVSIVVMAMLMRARRTAWTTPVPAAHAWRDLVGVLSLAAWFYAIGHLPLATAMTLNYMSSIWIGVFILGGGLLFGRSTPGQGMLIAAVLASFAGVVMMLRPTLEQDQLFAGLVGLLSGLLAALAYMQVMVLGRAGEPEERTVFYFAVACALGGALGMAVFGVSPWDWGAAVWLLPIGILASGGQWCMTRAYSQGSTLVIANLQYSGIVFGALYSLLLFGDQIPLIGWLGMLVITGSGIMATVLRARALPRTPAEEH